MSRLRALLYKEWRDQRGVCLGAVGVCLVLALTAVRIQGVALMKRSMFVDTVLPVCCVIFAAVLATEAIARDAQSRVADTLARLPASRTLVWCSKLFFVLLAVAALVVVLVPLDFVLSLTSGSATLNGNQVLARPQFWAVTGALAAACFAVACILRRALPAAIVGALTICALPLFAGWLPPCALYDWLYVFLAHWSPTELACVTCAACIVGSLLAFSIRRADPFGWRRGLAAAAGALVVAIPLLSGSAVRARAAFDIRFGDPSAKLALVTPSPDGRFVAVQVTREWKAGPRWLEVAGPNIVNGLVRSEVWLLALPRGTWNEIDACSRMPMFTRKYGIEAGPWDARGRLAVFSSPSPFGTGPNRADLIDPDSGSELLGSVKGIARLRAIAAETGSVPWYESSSSSRKAEIVLHWTERGIDLRLDESDVFATSPEPGIVFIEREDGLVRHDMATGGETRLRALAHRGYGLHVAPDGKHLEITGLGPSSILDACDGHTLAVLPPTACLQGWSRVPGRLGLVSVFVSPSESGWFALDEQGQLQPLPTAMTRCVELGADRIVAYDEHTIESMKLDGSERQVLYDARP